MRSFHASLVSISSNARVKEYPSQIVLQIANAPIFREKGWEGQKRPYDVAPKGKGKDPQRALAVSRARAKAAVRDIAMCNQFSYFFTWTLSPEKIDRYDSEKVGKAVQTFLKNVSHRKGFSYLCVPELHKDGAIHIHGLCNLGGVKIMRAINHHTKEFLSTDRGQPIYNMTDWSLGYSTCIPIDENYERTCNYLAKYFTKDSCKIFGKWYFSSRNLVKHPPTSIIAGGMDYDLFIAENPKAPIIPLYGDVCMTCQQQAL